MWKYLGRSPKVNRLASQAIRRTIRRGIFCHIRQIYALADCLYFQRCRLSNLGSRENRKANPRGDPGYLPTDHCLCYIPSRVGRRLHIQRPCLRRCRLGSTGRMGRQRCQRYQECREGTASELQHQQPQGRNDGQLPSCRLNVK